MRIFVITVGIIFILVFIGLCGFFLSYNNTDAEVMSTYDWIHRFTTKATPIPGEFNSCDIEFIESNDKGKTTVELWECKFIYDDGYDIWKVVITFDSQYTRDNVPGSAVKLIRGDAVRFVSTATV